MLSIKVLKQLIKIYKEYLFEFFLFTKLKVVDYLFKNIIFWRFIKNLYLRKEGFTSLNSYFWIIIFKKAKKFLRKETGDYFMIENTV